MATPAAKKQLPRPEVTAYPRRMPRIALPMAKAAVFAADAALAAFAFIAAFVLRSGGDVLSQTAWAWSKAFVPYAGIFYFAIIVRIAMLAYQRVYRFEGAFSYTREAIKVFKAVAIGSLLIIAWAFLFRGGFAFREFSYSRSVFILDFGIALFAYQAFHLFVRYAQASIRRRDANLLPTLIVGTNTEAAQTIGELRRRLGLGYRVVGVVNGDAEKKFSHGDEFHGVPIVGSFAELPELISVLGIREAIITDTNVSSDRLFEAMMLIGRRQRVEFRIAPGLLNLLPQKTSIEQIGVLPMVRLFREPLSEVERFIKRGFDLAISFATLAFLFPAWLIISIAIRLDSSGAILFRQERVGMDGRVFLCYKFRTMHADADEDVHREVYKKNIAGNREANAGDDEDPIFGKVPNDPRITRFGRLLRRWSLDEIPQLLNVLKGDMSIVGPRPPIPYEVSDYDLSHRKRLDMKPGITGLWQVSGRNRLTFDEMVRADLYYIENWSLWFDLKIIMLTLPAVFRGEGAR